jgi:hypothetical protein
MPRGIPRQAKNAPVFKSTGPETSEMEIGRTERTAPTPENPVGAPKLVDVASRMPDQEKLANLAFMNEKVTIRVATTTDKNAEQVFELNIGGKSELFRRGETKTVHRYFVDHMARMKVTSYSDREVTNAEGIKQILHDPHTGLKYDFAMVRDDNPMGESWLRATLAMGG